VALAGYALFAQHTDAGARTGRSTLEVGPSRVLSVAPVTPLALLRAVRAADPSGRYAMAATQITDVSGTRVLAVDSTRLAAVLPPGPGGDGAALAARLRPDAPRQVEVTGADLTVTIDPATSRAGVRLVLRLLGTAGPVNVVFGPVRSGTADYEATAPGCSTARPCELLGLGLSAAGNLADPSADLPARGTNVRVTALRQASPARDVLPPALLTASAPWRTSSRTDSVGPVISASAAGLRIAVPTTGFTRDMRMDPTAYLITVPVPVPAVTAGPGPQPDLPGVLTVTPFGFAGLPVRTVATVGLLPRLERAGMLVDLDYAQDLVGTESGGQAAQVWLAAGTPDAVLRSLAAHGLVTTATQSIGARDAEYAREPAALGQRFQVLAGLVAVAVAAMAFVLVGTVERRSRAGELRALRRQGLSAGTARVVAFTGYGLLAAGGVVVGVAGAVVVRLLSGAPPLFADGWHVLPRPGALPATGFAQTFVVAAVLLGLAAVLAGVQLTRAVAGRNRRGA